MRIIIAGWPRSGKSSFAKHLGEQMGVEPKATDTLMNELSWSEVSSQVAEWFDAPGPWIIEGVAVMRALRKWHRHHGPEVRPPFDKIYVMKRPDISNFKPGQISMGKGIDFVFEQLENWLGQVEVK